MFGGVRTFPLIGLLGYVAGALAGLLLQRHEKAANLAALRSTPR